MVHGRFRETFLNFFFEVSRKVEPVVKKQEFRRLTPLRATCFAAPLHTTQVSAKSSTRVTAALGGFCYNGLTSKISVALESGRIREVVTYERWSHRERVVLV